MDKQSLIESINKMIASNQPQRTEDIQDQIDDIIEFTFTTLDNTPDKKYYDRVFDKINSNANALLTTTDQNSLLQRVPPHIEELQKLYVPGPIESLKNIQIKASKELERLKKNIGDQERITASQFEDHKKRQDKISQEHNETLQFEAPAKMWEQASNRHLKIGFVMTIIMAAILCFGGKMIYDLLMNIPNDIVENFIASESSKSNVNHVELSWFEQKSKAIRWSFLFLTLVSFFAYVVKSISKVMFSSFHLASDCRERSSLAEFYLSLLNRDAVDVSERAIVLQSLFSRSDSGLLSDIGSPTMPGDIISKLNKPK